MDEKIQLLHPEAKKSVRIDIEKYELVKEAILQVLSSRTEATHKEMLQLLQSRLRDEGVIFEGSLEWYMEYVKLDLEARNLVRRNRQKKATTYSLP